MDWTLASDLKAGSKNDAGGMSKPVGLDGRVKLFGKRSVDMVRSSDVVSVPQYKTGRMALFPVHLRLWDALFVGRTI